jgi:glucosamine--fructose-6-phosphate aminotransferase (isomerizing)
VRSRACRRRETSYHAGLIAKYWFEQLAKISVDVDIASEFRYRDPILPKNSVGIFISQSGETADTLAALRYINNKNIPSLAIVNAPESTMWREAKIPIRTLAGPEIGVASTKAFTTQLIVLASLAVVAARARNSIDAKAAEHFARLLTEVPQLATHILHLDEKIEKIAREVYEARDVLYIGRGTSYPVALEGALKLKEISYIHAEGYAAGEMKHGPIALIDEEMPIVVIAPTDHWFDKTASNLHEVLARGGRLIVLSDKEGLAKLKLNGAHTVELPKTDPFIAPILYTLPVQLLAYHAAVLKGTDVDQPRNLAKSVTVE